MKEEMWENIIAVLIMVLVIGGLVWWYAAARQTSSVLPEQPDQRFRVPFGISPRIGMDNAPVVVIEFSDFECPYCGRFAQEFPQIKEQHIDTGQVLFIYKYFPLSRLHKHALPAAEAAACAADQEKFWEYHDLLYAHQDALEQEDLLSYAEELGLDMDAFTACVSSGKKGPEVQLDVQAGFDAGVTGTPTFFFNGRRVGGTLTMEQFSAEVEKELTAAAS